MPKKVEVDGKEIRVTRRKANDHLPIEEMPHTPARIVSTNRHRQEITEHAAKTLLTDDVSKAWHKKVRARRQKQVDLIETEAELEQLFFDYVDSCSKRPHIHKRPTKDGKAFCTQSDLPLSQAGICAFAGLSVKTWRNWKTPTHGSFRGEDFAYAIEAIETKMWAINLEKAGTGELTPQLMMRLLGLSDKSEVVMTHTDGSDRESAGQQAVERARMLLTPPAKKEDGKDGKSGESS